MTAPTAGHDTAGHDTAGQDAAVLAAESTAARRADRAREDREARAQNRRHREWALATAVGLTLVAAALRLVGIGSSYDLFIDEATYAEIARDSTLATGPMLHGLPFVLHTPVGVLLLAGQAHLLGAQEIAPLVFALRPFVAIVGALTVGVLYFTLHRAGLRMTALIAALLVAFDPFIISFDSRVMLEAPAQLFAVLTIASALRAASADAGVRARWTVATAVFGALTFGTKETFGLVILATLILVALTAPRGARRAPALAAAGVLVGYALVNLAMIAWAGPATWWDLRTQGLQRLLGLEHSTGFKAEGVQVSLLDRLFANGVELGATYAILALGGICALVLLWRLRGRRPAPSEPGQAMSPAVRILSLWALSACGYVAYAVVFGSLEEQMFYIAAAPCAVVLAIAVTRIRRDALRRIAIAGAGVLVLVQLVAWVHTRTTPDDAYARMLAEIHEVAPEASVVAVTEETAQFVLTGYELGEWATVPELIDHEVDYVLVSSRLAAQGYGLADVAFVDELGARGTLVSSWEGRSSDLQLYDVREITSPSGAGSPEDAP